MGILLLKDLLVVVITIVIIIVTAEIFNFRKLKLTTVTTSQEKYRKNVIYWLVCGPNKHLELDEIMVKSYWWIFFTY